MAADAAIAESKLAFACRRAGGRGPASAAQSPWVPTSTSAAAGNHTHSDYANDADVVHDSGDKTVAGVKTFSGTAIFNAAPQVAVGSPGLSPGAP